MICTNCDNEIDTDSKYCKFCGCKIEQQNTSRMYLPPAYFEHIYATVIGPSELHPAKGNWWNKGRDEVGRWFKLRLQMFDINGHPTKGKGKLTIYLISDDDKIKDTHNPVVENIKSKSIFQGTYDISYENFYDDGSLEFIVKNKDEGLIFAKVDYAGQMIAGTQTYGSTKQLWIVFELESNLSVIGQSTIPWG